VHIHDYKTGKPPTPAQMKAFEKQLLLEAAMAERGGFAALGPRRVEAVSYIQLGGDGAERRYEIDAETTAEVWRDLNRLIAAYNRRETGYTARRALFERREAGAYDHLARHGEWQVGDAPGPEEVG
jgi:ATP-dependent helicase/nuclease subunit B